MSLTLIDKIALIAGIALPLFNIPLIIRIVQRKSSSDLSLWWVFGVWTCIILMAPSGLQSEDIVWRVFNYGNVILFTVVAAVTLKYRKKP